MTRPIAVHGVAPARTHREAAEQLRRPFAPGAVGFRVMRRVESEQHGTAVVVAPYVRAQSSIVRLSVVTPGRWRETFEPVGGERLAGVTPGALCVLCRLTITLPHDVGEPDVEVSYEDVGEISSAFDNTIKALYSDARKRAGVAAGIGAYLYTAMPEIVLPLNSSDLRTLPGGDIVVSAACEARLRREYQARILRSDVIATFGQVFAHGEPDGGTGSSDDTSAAEQGTDAVAAAPVTHTDAGAGRHSGPEPPPAPVALAGEQPSGQRRSPASREATTLSGEQQQRICELAEARDLTRGDVANVVRRVVGQPTVDSETAAREFDGGLLGTTPAHHMPRIVDAIVHSGDDRQLALAGTNGHVPIDYRDL